MRKNYKRAMAIFLSLAISEMTSINANAQKWIGNGYYAVRDKEDIESDKELNEMNLDYQIIMNKLTYKELCCFDFYGGDEEVATWFPIAIYTSADRAIYQIDALKYEKFYLPMANARIKDAYQLIDGRPTLIEDINILDNINKDNLSFSIVQADSNGNDQIVGYINGKDMMATTPSFMKSYEEDKKLIKSID